MIFRGLLVAGLLFAGANDALAEPEAGTGDSRDRELVQLYDSLGRLEKRIFELEADKAASGGSDRSLGEARISLSGSAELAYLDGGADAFATEGGMQLWDARLFLSADLARDVTIGALPLVRDAGLLVEANLVRRGREDWELGETYVDLRGLFGNDWLNLQLGRFQIPFGENYERFSMGRVREPFFADTGSAPWFWDEGVKLWGTIGEGQFGYDASFTDGAEGASDGGGGLNQVTLKLFLKPTDWLYLSQSYLSAGELGTTADAARSSIWFGETWASAFGSNSATLPNYDHGAVVPDGPNELGGVQILGSDIKLNYQEAARLWLSYGAIEIDSKGADFYDRNLRYWMAELTLEGRLISRALRPVNLTLRGNGLGTYDRARGYLLDIRHGRSLGYNMSSLETYALAVNWELSDSLLLRAEYSIQDIDLVRGVPVGIQDAADGLGYFGLGAAVQF